MFLKKLVDLLPKPIRIPVLLFVLFISFGVIVGYSNENPLTGSANVAATLVGFFIATCCVFTLGMHFATAFIWGIPLETRVALYRSFMLVWIPSFCLILAQLFVSARWIPLPDVPRYESLWFYPLGLSFFAFLAFEWGLKVNCPWLPRDTRIVYSAMLTALSPVIAMFGRPMYTFDLWYGLGLLTLMILWYFTGDLTVGDVQKQSG